MRFNVIVAKYCPCEACAGRQVDIDQQVYQGLREALRAYSMPSPDAHEGPDELSDRSARAWAFRTGDVWNEGEGCEAQPSLAWEVSLHINDPKVTAASRHRILRLAQASADLNLG